MVYGLEHCPYVKSYAQKSDLNLFVLSHVHEEYNIPVLDIAFNVHSINSLCGLQVSKSYFSSFTGGKH
jgi:hypothetical protein